MKEVSAYKPKRFILSWKAKRKNAVRHIKDRFESKEEIYDAIYKGSIALNSDYIYSIYTYDWVYIEDVDISIYKKKGGK